MEFAPQADFRAGVPAAAIEKAERYRLLNEPMEAESICLDVLAIEPEKSGRARHAHSRDHRRSRDNAVGRRRTRAPTYCRGCVTSIAAIITAESFASATAWRFSPTARRAPAESAYQWIRDAMELYERAEKLRPAGEDESILRWNTCARLIARFPHLAPVVREEAEASLE